MIKTDKTGFALQTWTPVSPCIATLLYRFFLMRSGGRWLSPRAVLKTSGMVFALEGVTVVCLIVHQKGVEPFTRDLMRAVTRPSAK